MSQISLSNRVVNTVITTIINTVSAGAFLLSLALTESLWAHGENKLGPHGGAIRMPGAFHTEIKKASQNTFEVYLLDMEWKNPLIAASTVTAQWKPKDKGKARLACHAKQNRFICEFPKGSRLRNGDTVMIEATRQGMTGTVVTYEYPFRAGETGASASHHDH